MKAALLALLLAAPFGFDKLPHRYGRVVLQNGTRRAGVDPVLFDHWMHRARYTCRLCHVDIGFAMEANATGVSAATNRKGFHCGACHDGKTSFAACTTDAPSPACARCHGGDDEASRTAYAALSLPRGPGGEVDWQKAEEQWLVHPADTLPGISIKRGALAMDKDVALSSKAGWMTEVKFSHRKHAVWNGCEVCHPEIFPSTQAGTVRFNMLQISGGGACGVCHGKVAFALSACDRCHTRPVAMH